MIDFRRPAAPCDHPAWQAADHRARVALTLHHIPSAVAVEVAMLGAAEAIEACMGCPLRPDCAAACRKYHQADGVAAGLLWHKGARIDRPDGPELDEALRSTDEQYLTRWHDRYAAGGRERLTVHAEWEWRRRGVPA